MKQLDFLSYFNTRGLLLVVTEIGIRYSRELKLFDELTIRTRVSKKDPYLVFDQKIYLNEPRFKVCSAEVKTLLTDRNKTICDIPEEMLIKLVSA